MTTTTEPGMRDERFADWNDDTIIIGRVADWTPEALKTLRASHGWTQADLAAKIGVGQTAVSNWETGRNRPNSLAALELARIRRRDQQRTKRSARRQAAAEEQ